MSHPTQNWKCKCGRGPSLEHSVGGYCSGREVIESLEAGRDRLKVELEKAKYALSYSAPEQLNVHLWIDRVVELEKDRDLWWQKAERLAKLLHRNLERMALINNNCIHDDLRDCPNHRLMQETKEALAEFEETR